MKPIISSKTVHNIPWTKFALNLSLLALCLQSALAEPPYLLPPNLPLEGGQVSVKWFGAAGDGVQDDTFAIQNAIDVASNIGLQGNNKAEGIRVYLPPGDYLISDTLKIYGGYMGRTHLSGAGSSSTTITLAPSANVDMIQLEPVHAGVGGHHHSVISDLRLFGNNGSQPSSTLVGIEAERAFSGFVLRNLKIDNISGTGVRFVLSSNPSIENVGIARPTQYGLWIDGGNQDSINISNLEVADAGLSAVYIRNQTPHWTNILFHNFRAEAYAAGMFDMVLFENCNNAAITFISPKFHVVGTAPAGSYTGFRITGLTRPRLSVIGWAATTDQGGNVQPLDNIVRDDIANVTIPGVQYENPVIYLNHAPLLIP